MGYVISSTWLGIAIETITGTSLNQNLKKYFCYPLNLENKSFKPDALSKANLAPVYFRDTEATYSNTGNKVSLGYNPLHYGGEEMTSNAGDYLTILPFFFRNIKSSSAFNINTLLFKNQM